MSKYTDMSNELLKLIGGKDNVASVTHCATRLRIRLHDEDNVPAWKKSRSCREYWAFRRTSVKFRSLLDRQLMMLIKNL